MEHQDKYMNSFEDTAENLQATFHGSMTQASASYRLVTVSMPQ